MKKSTKIIFLFCLTVSALIPFNNYTKAQQSTNIQGSEKGTYFSPTSNSKEAIAFFEKGLVALDLGEFNTSRILLTQAIEKDPDFGLAYLLRASIATSTKEYADDINQGKSKLANGAEWEKMYADFMYTNLTGDREKGLEIAKKIAEAYPDAARAQADLGNAYFGNNQFTQAEAAFLKAVEFNPTWTGGYSGLVNIYLFGDKKDLQKAEQNAIKVVSLAPNSPGAHIGLGDAYRAQNNFQKAKDEYTKAIQLDKDGAEAHYKVGHANVYLGNFADARKNFKDAGDRDMRKPFSIMLEATSYAYEGDSKKTMKQLLAAASMAATADGDKNVNNSDQLNFLSSAANVALHNGDAATLKELIPQIVPLSNAVVKTIGTSESLLYDQADMLRWEVLLDALEGRYSDAKQKADKIKTTLEPIQDSRKLEGYHFAMAMVELKQKNYKEAIGHLQLGDPQSIYNKYLFAKAYEGMGDKENATKYYTEVSVYNFNNLDNALIRYEVMKKLKTM